MPPDAEKVRQRKLIPEATNHSTHPVVQERICSVKDLKSNEVCIDGSIYDLTDFDHPGGDAIQVFGGNDVTVQYKMIHPYHTGKHLEKMKRIGKVTDFQCE